MLADAGPRSKGFHIYNLYFFLSVRQIRSILTDTTFWHTVVSVLETVRLQLGMFQRSLFFK